MRRFWLPIEEKVEQKADKREGEEKKKDHKQEARVERRAVHRPTPWEAYSTNEWGWVARRLRAVKGKLAALIASLTLRDPGQPFATVPPGL